MQLHNLRSGQEAAAYHLLPHHPRLGVGPDEAATLQEILLQQRSGAWLGGFLTIERSSQAVSPALRCVTVLTVCFFAVYLVIVAVRLAKTVALRGVKKVAIGRGDGWAGRCVACEEGFAEANGTLEHVPMLCITFVAARLRAMQLDHKGGDPPRWVQVSMYVCTSALFVRFVFDFIAGATGTAASRLQNRCVSVTRSLVSIAMCLFSLAIVAGMLLMVKDVGFADEPALAPTLWCVAVLSASYFMEFLIVEVASLVFGSLAVSRAYDERLRDGVETMVQQFPSMLCVLLVAMTMRMVQLSLKLPQWAVAAVYLCTCAVMVQGLLAVINMLLVAAMQARPLQRTGGSGGRVAMTCQLMLLACLCGGAAATLASVFAMEKDALAELWPQPVGHEQRPDGSSRLSTTMRCVMMLTSLYFSVVLSIIAAGFCCGALREWASSALMAVQSDLAFAPTICMMMIGVRLRAMQLKLADPQPWAQTAMYVATYAVMTHIICSLLYPAPSSNATGPEGVGEAKELSLCSKLCVIVLLALRYIASIVLFVAIGVLIAALFSMNPTTTGPSAH